MDMVEIQVQVPAQRETEFYRWFADWRDQVLPVAQGASRKNEVAGKSTSEAAATAWWKLLTSKERAIWSAWIDASPHLITADEIVSALGLKGSRDIPGVLSWSGRKGDRVGFDVHWVFRNDPLTGQPTYGIEDAEYANVVRHAKAAN